MTWHALASKEKGKMNHPCDGKAWKYFDMIKPEFSCDPRNVRLGLAADGFNPFGMMSQNYSMWPPLIKKLPRIMVRSLVERGCRVLISNESGSLMDHQWGFFPARSSLIWVEWARLLTHAQPVTRKPFPQILAGDLGGCQEQRSLLLASFFYLNTTRCHAHRNDALEALLNTLLQNDKTKDTPKARQDLEKLNVRKELWLAKKPNGKFEKPHPKYSFTTENRKRFCKFIKGVRLPDGFGSTLSIRTPNDNNITGMKSHDCHIMMHRLLPYGVQQYLPKSIAAPIIELCLFFKQLCARTLIANDMGKKLKHTIDHGNRLIRWNGFSRVVYSQGDCSEDLFLWLVDLLVHGVSTLGLDGEIVLWSIEEIRSSLYIGTQMACVGPSYHGGDAGGDPPNRPNRPVPTQCQSSMPRIETGSEALRKAYRKNKKQPLPIGFDVTDLGTYHPIGDYSSMLNTLMGETIRPLPFNCEWDEIPKALKAHIFPTLESYFNLAHWYANQEKVVVGDNVYTVGDRVKLGLELKLRVLWRKAKNRIKANHFTRYPSAEVAKNHLPPPSVWEGRTQEEWNELVDWFSHPDQVARSAVNAANRAKNTIPTHQGKKSFAQGRNEYKVEHGHYEDLIETWRKTHSEPKSGRWKSKENKQRYLQMKAMQDQVRGGVIPFMTDQQILDQVVPSENRQNMSGMGRKLPGSGSTSRKHPNKVFADVLTRDEMTQILRQKEQENELLRKQVEEAQQRAYLASLKADASSQWSTAAYQNTQTLYGTLGTFFGHYNSPNYARPFSPHDFNLVPPPPPGPSMPHAPEWAHLLQPPFPTNQPLRPLQPPYPGPFPQPPYPGSFPQPSYNEPFPIPPVNNNTFNNCYHPVYNSTQGIASSSNDPAQRSFYNLVMNPHMTDSRTLDELARDNSLANNDEGASGEEEEEEEGNEGTNDGDYSEENEEEEEGTDGNEE
ncbi:Myc-type, basic helix-loop-helix domain-containing protein [Tanacetum coccineum]